MSEFYCLTAVWSEGSWVRGSVAGAVSNQGGRERGREREREVVARVGGGWLAPGEGGRLGCCIGSCGLVLFAIARRVGGVGVFGELLGFKGRVTELMLGRWVFGVDGVFLALLS